MAGCSIYFCCPFGPPTHSWGADCGPVGAVPKTVTSGPRKYVSLEASNPHLRELSSRSRGAHSQEAGFEGPALPRPEGTLKGAELWIHLHIRRMLAVTQPPLQEHRVQPAVLNSSSGGHHVVPVP
jgi:hypothetical protein